MDVRLQQRYWRLVREHINAPRAVAAGLKAVPDAVQRFASTQALWRFLANLRVTLPQLVVPLRTRGCQAAAESASPYVLLIHDWSKLDDGGHASQTDQTPLSHRDDVGYELYTALLVDAASGSPLAPMELQLLCARGVHTTRQTRPARRQHHLNQLLPTMRTARTWSVPRMLVQVIDREADSQADFRLWSAAVERFVVRADATRKVDFQGTSFLLPELAETLARQEHFVSAGPVALRGQSGIRWVAQADVRLSGPARKRTAAGRIKVGREPLALRLVISRILDEDAQVLAEWFLLTNVPAEVPAVTIADWYYWRWRIESYHKLLKSGGQQLESWQQESAEAIAKRLLIAAMVCVCAWELQRQTTPEAVECQQFQVRLSGRQRKRAKPVTTSALIAGLHLLLPDLLEHDTPEQLRTLAHKTVPVLCKSG